MKVCRWDGGGGGLFGGQILSSPLASCSTKSFTVFVSWLISLLTGHKDERAFHLVHSPHTSLFHRGTFLPSSLEWIQLVDVCPGPFPSTAIAALFQTAKVLVLRFIMYHFYSSLCFHLCAPAWADASWVKWWDCITRLRYFHTYHRGDSLKHANVFKALGLSRVWGGRKKSLWSNGKL